MHKKQIVTLVSMGFVFIILLSTAGRALDVPHSVPQQKFNESWSVSFGQNTGDFIPEVEAIQGSADVIILGYFDDSGVGKIYSARMTEDGEILWVSPDRCLFCRRFVGEGGVMSLPDFHYNPTPADYRRWYALGIGIRNNCQWPEMEVRSGIFRIDGCDIDCIHATWDRPYHSTGQSFHWDQPPYFKSDGTYWIDEVTIRTKYYLRDDFPRRMEYPIHKLEGGTIRPLPPEFTASADGLP